MSAIVRYVAPLTQLINGELKPEHHFWLDISESDDFQEVARWVYSNFQPKMFQYWPEVVSGIPVSTSMIQFHVILHQDRDAMLFRLRW